jgi:hypothetical protein
VETGYFSHENIPKKYSGKTRQCNPSFGSSQPQKVFHAFSGYDTHPHVTGILKVCPHTSMRLKCCKLA